MFPICWNVFYFILLLQFYSTDLRITKSNKDALRVMGGRDAAPGEFPYVMRLEIQVKRENHSDAFHHLCTCSLLKPTWSITAAHCIIEGMISTTSASPEIRAVIRYTLLTTRDTGTSLVLSSAKHPSFVENKLSGASNDIGLLQSEKVPVTKYAKISSVDYSTLLGHQVLALGYGITIGPGGVYDVPVKLNKSLQVLDVIVAQCIISPPLYPAFCIMGRCGKWSTLCPGDSGGPVLHPSGIVGLNMAGVPTNCNKKRAMSPTYATLGGWITPVSPYIDWIAKMIK